MEVKLSHHDWRALRRVLRARGKSVLGSELRMDMSRRTQSGSFLTLLVADGLLKVASPSDNPMDAKYLLTAQGREAAEYGVYDVAWEIYRSRGS